jgi:hypothetical protein
MAIHMLFANWVVYTDLKKSFFAAQTISPAFGAA